MINFIYNIVITLILPFALLRLLWRSRKNPDYRRRLGERFTFGKGYAFASTTTKESPIWIHTVSVGEFLAALPLIEMLLNAGEKILVTTTTPTGSAMVSDKLGNRVAHQYLPFDARCLVKRFLDTTQPSIAVFVETEVWANYLNALKKRNVPALLINARLSERSFQGYQKLGQFARDAVGSFTEVACQNDSSRTRFQALGARASTLGNLKFDLRIPINFEQKQQSLQAVLANRAFILLASTHKGEEEILLQAYKSSNDNRLLVIAPRHPERSNEIIAQAKQLGLSAVRYTDNALSVHPHILVVDILGQLLPFYSLADYAIIGGSFVPRGGHNPLEAALFATPCVIGQYYFNFENLIDEMLIDKAIEVVSQEQLFHHQPDDGVGQNALRFLKANQGAVEAYYRLIMTYKSVNRVANIGDKND